MTRAFFHGIGWGLLIIGAFFGWGGWITSTVIQCDDGKIPIAHWGHGVYCVQAEKLNP